MPPMTALLLARLFVLAAAKAACDDEMCSEQPPMEMKGSSVLQRRSVHTTKTIAQEPLTSAHTKTSVQEVDRTVASGVVLPGVKLMDSGCTDTEGWANMFGYDCALYASCICQNGAGIPGMEYMFGDWLGNPELNCCACGKGSEPDCSTHGCPWGYNAVSPDSKPPSDAMCCQQTCAVHMCASDMEPNWERRQSVEVSEVECCQTTTTTTTPAPFQGVGKAQYVRISPQSWLGSIAMRAAVLEGDDLDMVDPPENMRSYSSVKPLNNAYVQEGEEGWPGSNKGRSMESQGARHGWSPKVSQVGEWMQIDLSRSRDVRGVVIVGKPKSGCPHLNAEFPTSVKIETATTEDPDNFQARNDGQVWNTMACQNKGLVRIVFATDTETVPIDPDALLPVLVKAGHECKSSDKNMGKQSSMQACADKVKENGGIFFIYGTGWKAGRCYLEYTDSASCSQDWESDHYDFYALEAPASSEPVPATTQAPSTTPTAVEEICPALLYNNKILCNDGTAVGEGECCLDNGFCPSDCFGGSSKSTDSNGQSTCTCNGCRKQRKLELSDSDAMLKAHNYLRCLHGHDELTWDADVAENADAAAETSCKDNDLRHSDSYGMTPSAGENLAMGLTSPEGAAAAWYNELTDPGYNAGDWGTEAADKGVGHYTALIWKSTQKLGCKSCVSAQGRTMWACQYAQEAPNSGDQAKWEENVPQSDVPEATPETCCARIYG